MNLISLIQLVLMWANSVNEVSSVCNPPPNPHLHHPSVGSLCTLFKYSSKRFLPFLQSYIFCGTPFATQDNKTPHC